MRIQTGQQAPDFSITDMEGREHRLSDYKDRRLLLAFHRYAS